jgi:hypothetical protein
MVIKKILKLFLPKDTHLDVPMYRPDGWKTARATRSSCPSKVPMGTSLMWMEMSTAVEKNITPLTYLSKECKLTVPSAPAVTRLTELGDCVSVAPGWKSIQLTRSFCPLSVSKCSLCGIDQSLTSPDHEPVARTFEFGAKVQYPRGRSSPICDANTLKV